MLVEFSPTAVGSRPRTMSPRALMFFLTSLLIPFGLAARQTTAPTSEPAYWITLHQADDQKLASWARMPVADLRELRHTAGIADDTPFSRVSHVDALTLPKHLILFVSALGNQPCLKIGVYQRHGSGFRGRWSVQETPDGSAFCQEPNCPMPEILPTNSGKITISVWFRKKGERTEACDNLRRLTYRPKGSSYRLTADEITRAPCDVGTYWAGLALVYSRAASGERLATLRAFGSLTRQNEFAIVIEKTPTGITISRVGPREDLQKQTAAPALTPSQCLAIARNVDFERKVFPVRQEVAQRLVDDLATIDLNRHDCVRDSRGQCAYIFDTLVYFLQRLDGSASQVMDVSHLQGLTSENPELSEWIARLLEEIDRAQ